MILKGTKTIVSGAEEETRRQPDGGLIAAFATEIGFMRHDGVIHRVSEADVDVHLGLEGMQAGRGKRSGLAVRPQIGAQRHYRLARRARFIHKYRTIAISQRCHHFSVETPHPAPASPFTTAASSLCSPKQHDNPPPC